MKVAITARMRNGYLWEAAQKLGSIKALAEHLGIHYAEVAGWVNFGRYPYMGPRSKVDWKEVERKLLLLTGALLEDIFPPELKQESFTKRKKSLTVMQEVQMSALTAGDERLAISSGLENVESEIDHEQLAERIKRTLQMLTSREEKVIKMRFGLDGEGERTYDEIAQHFNVTRERIRQIEAKALRKLMHPNRSRRLRPYAITCDHDGEINLVGRCKRCGVIVKPIEIAPIEEGDPLDVAVAVRDAKAQEEE